LKGDVGPVGPIGERGEPGPRGEKGDLGRPGEDGRDALQIDVLDAIDPARRYARNTYVHHLGGIVRSTRTTDPLKEGVSLDKAGWQVVVQGLSTLSVELSEDGRTVSVSLSLTDGYVQKTAITLPTMIYREVWKAETPYDKGDTVTWDGSVWVRMSTDQNSKTRPGSSSDWRLAVKRGQDGKDGARGEKGEKGNPGNNGRDLTQLGPDGSKW
jgi:integrin beta 3